MKTIIYILFLTLLSSCGDKNSVIIDSADSKIDTNQIAPVDPKMLEYDSIISLLPSISDTTTLIDAIKKRYNLETGEFEGWSIKESITNCYKIKVGKHNDSIVFLEYDYNDGCMAAYPWKYQLLIKPNTSNLLKKSTYKSFNLIDFDGENLILGINESGKGYGSHEILRLKGNSFINIFDHNHFLAENETHNPVSTVDRHSDDGYYTKPLIFKTSDLNKDGHTDIQLTGVRRMVKKEDNNGKWLEIKPYEKPIKFNYIYNSVLGKFIPEENYQKKYDDLY